MSRAEDKQVTPKSEDYARWYTDVVQKSELADYAPTRGSMVIRPHGYALWEKIQGTLDRMFKETGHRNVYFPLLIPESFIKKEAEHVEGFAPELAVVTHGGGKRLEEPLIVRPTSETIINATLSKWIRSYRDLPLLINQWCNIVRWELRPRLFLRTLEFLWQEGHTAHATEAEAEEEALQMLEIYRKFGEEYAAIPVLVGRKSESEKFAGAVHTYAIEAMMGDRRALQGATSHNLGQNFARAFGIQYQDRSNELQYVWQTSWGLSTRVIGAIVMVHGDDQGLVLPPRLTPIQVVVVPIWGDDRERDPVMNVVAEIKERLGDQVALEVDDRDEYSPGWKFNEWEQKGVPLRIEIGPQDVANEQVVLVRRDTGEKLTVAQTELSSQVHKLLEEIQQNLFDRALRFQQENTHEPEDFEAFKRIIDEQGGFLVAWWCGSADCETAIKEETKATIRCIPFDQPEGTGGCIYCDNEAKEQVVLAKAY